MTPSDDKRPIPAVEVSQKYMAWNIKEISESLKMIAMVAKSIDETLKKIANVPCMKESKQQENDTIPF